MAVCPPAWRSCRVALGAHRFPPSPSGDNVLRGCRITIGEIRTVPPSPIPGQTLLQSLNTCLATRWARSSSLIPRPVSLARRTSADAWVDEDLPGRLPTDQTPEATVDNVGERHDTIEQQCRQRSMGEQVECLREIAVTHVREAGLEVHLAQDDIVQLKGLWSLTETDNH